MSDSQPSSPTKKEYEENELKRERSSDSNRLFVYNLTWDTTWQQVKDYFSGVGPVTFADILREGGPEGRSKGCAVVEFEKNEDAEKAINELNGTSLNGRTIYCREDVQDPRARASLYPVGKKWRIDEGDTYNRYHSQKNYYNGDDPYFHRGRFLPINNRHMRYQRARHHPYFDVGSKCGGSGGGGPGSGGEKYNPITTIGRKVFVSNLSFETTWQELKDHFKAAGNVYYVFLKTDEKGQSRGCGTVEFETSAEALRAISMLSNSTLGGRQIVVREDRADAAKQAEMNPVFNDADLKMETKVCVYGLPFSYEPIHLLDFMRAAGPIINASIVKGPDGASRGFGKVLFETVVGAQRAVQLYDGRELHGRIVKVQFDR